MTDLRDMPTLNTGVFVEGSNFDITTLCMKHFLDSEYKKNCSSIPGRLPSAAGALLFFQGVSTRTHHLIDPTGTRLANGTWTGALGQLQSGLVDLWAGNAFVTLERSTGFQFTTPFTLEKYGALMLRQQLDVSIDAKSVTAGIDWRVYALILAFVFFNVIIGCIHERLQQMNERNQIWHHLLSLFPINGSLYPNQHGLTRKVLMTTSGFAILILSSLYLAKQAEELMVPRPPPVFTIDDIHNAIDSHRSKLVIQFEGSPVLNYVTSMSEQLQTALQSNPPIYLSNLNSSELEAINTHNGIYIGSDSALLYALSQISSNLCKKYVFITFDEWTRMYGAIIMRKGRSAVLETMNAIVAERMSYVDNHIQSFQLSEECRKHIFPVHTPVPNYAPLQLVKMEGVFVFLGVLLCLSLTVFGGELICRRFRSEGEIFVIPIRFRTSLSADKQRVVYEKYARILDIIASDTH